MNRKLADFFMGYGMKINGNNAYGVVSGYETNVIVRVLDNVSPVAIHFSCYSTSEQKRFIEQAFRAAAIKFCRLSFTEYGIFIGLNDITIARLIKRMPDLLSHFIGILSQNGARDANFCPVCGDELDIVTTKKVIADGLYFIIDNNCVANLNKPIAAENKDFETAPNHYLRGFMGAVLGALAGSVIAVILNVIGFISSISAIVSVILGVYLYKKFQGKPNMMMIVIVACTTLVLMLGAVVGIYVAVAGVAAEEAGVSMSAIEAFLYLMEDVEFSRYFYSDLGLTLFFSIVGIGYQAVVVSKSLRRAKLIQ
ncbi:MAG: hypothetical protein PHP78_04180 [Candidatus Izemoplasmatales bacterium]|nr:hypothetical protein [Candidatus Izemoplasmatales bacterium]